MKCAGTKSKRFVSALSSFAEMETTFYIELTLKTVNGVECVARFFIGNDREKAIDVFRKLRGSNDVNEKDVMYMSFMETKNGLPLNVDMMSCTLDQLGENSKIITKELFKIHALS